MEQMGRLVQQAFLEYTDIMGLAQVVGEEVEEMVGQGIGVKMV